MSNQTPNADRADAVVTSDTAATVELTAYESGPAVVRETRLITLPEGRSRVFIGGLPKSFVPNSQTIVSVAGSGKLRVGQRSLRPANLTPQAMLAKSIGQKVTFIEETSAGNLRRTTGILEHIVQDRVAVLRVRGNKVLVVPITQKFELDNVPAGLSNLTILALEPTVEQGGDFRLKLLYEAGDVNWTPWYEVFYNHAAGKLERFACYVDLTNASGTNFNDAGVKLIPGHNHSDAANRARAKGVRAMAAPRAAMAFGGGGQESMLESADFSADAAETENVGDQKMYKLQDAVTLENGVPNSPVLVFFNDVPVIHEYHAYNAGQYYRLDGDNEADLPKLPVSVKLRLCNSKGNGMGKPLPIGDVRIFEPDSSGELQKTDSARISTHVSDGEEFALDLRNPARDIKVVRHQVSYKEDPRRTDKDDNDGDGGPIKPQAGVAGGPNVGMRPDLGGLISGQEGDAETTTAPEGGEAGGKKKRARRKKARYAVETREVTVLNFKDTDVEVVVHDSVPGDAKVIDKSHEFVKFTDNSGAGSFRVKVPAKSETAVAGEFKVRYTIKYKLDDEG